MKGVGERLRDAIPRGEFSRGVATLVAGTGLAQLIVIASSPVLTRLFTPSDYGVYAVAISILAVLITITCLRYEFAIPLPESDTAAANVLALALLTAVGTTVITGAILLVAGPWLVSRLGAPALGPYVWLIPIGQFCGAAGSALTLWAVRHRSFPVIAATRLTQSGAMVSAQVGLGLGSFGAPGLLIGDVAGRVLSSAQLARAAWRHHATSFHRVSRVGIADTARRYRRFPTLASPSALLSTLGVQAPLILLVALYGPQVGGLYALASRLCSLPLTLVANAVGQVFMGEAAGLARSDPMGLRVLFVTTTKSLARAALGPAALLALLAPLLAGIVFGAEWEEAGLYVAILAPMYYLSFVATATGDVLYVLERQDLHFGRELLRFTLLGGPVLVAAALGLPPLGAMALLSLAGCLNYGLYALFSWRAIVKHDPTTPITDVDSDTL